MLKSLTLQNFQKHELLVLDFTAGLNVMRAANESGKSTCYNAIAYALWGARALSLSLEETVTWGKPASALKVILEFFVAGVIYKITRSKSGAELVGGGMVASGQAEVSAAVERLTGANAAVGVATLLAVQGGLRSLLDGEAVSLIEKLSRMDIIDNLISSVQSNLPSGSTKLMEQTLAAMQDLTAPESDFSELVAEKQHASISIENAQAVLSTAQSKLAEAKIEAEGARERLALQASREVSRMQLGKQLAKAIPMYPEALDGTSAESLEVEAASQEEEFVLRKAYRLYLTAPPPEVNCSLGELHQQEKVNSEAHVSALKRERELITEIANTKASGIYEDSCSLCGKLLTDVPEVVEVNAKVAVRLAKLEEEKLSVQKTITEKSAAANNFRRLAGLDNLARQVFDQLPSHVSVNICTVPRTAKWLGAVPDLSPGPSLDYKAMLRERRVKESNYANAVALANQTEKLRADLKRQLDELVTDVAHPTDLKVLEEIEKLTQAWNSAQAELVKAKNLFGTAEASLKHAQALHEAQMETYRAKLSSKKQLEAQLTETLFNNGLIKKLREARPIVARELWNLVLHGVSHVFSQIRGTPSIVTRSDSKFLIDGKPVAAYSGSTKDALGLAIRIMLQKTFLPNILVIMLDEPAAGCDEVRESDMLASVVSADFAQVLLVTHSNLADTFAAHLIEL